MTKEVIYLTDLTFHIRDYRATGNFSKVAEKGRMYRPLPQEFFINTQTNSIEKPSKRTTISLPEDLQEKINRGEITVMVPESGLDVFAGKDVYEYLDSKNRKDRNELIHKNSRRIWRKE